MASNASAMVCQCLLTLGGIVAGERCQRWGAAAVVVSASFIWAAQATHAAISGHREVARAPRSESEPRELNWLPARDSSVVVAGIVSGCAEFFGGCYGVWGAATWCVRCGLPVEESEGTRGRGAGGQR
jgi:hypothetical protein